MQLQQSTAFRPFMRQSSMFAIVARWASKHHIIRCIRPATRERDNMLNVIVREWLVAVIAFLFLCSELSFNILSGVRAALGHLMRPALMPIYSALFSMRFTILLYLCLMGLSPKMATSVDVLPMCLMVCFQFLRVGFSMVTMVLLVVLTMVLIVLLPILLMFPVVLPTKVPTSLLNPFFVRFTILLSILSTPFFLLLSSMKGVFSILFFACLYPTCFTCSAQTIFAARPSVKKFRGGRFHLFACSTALQAFWWNGKPPTLLSLMLQDALLALRSQVIVARRFVEEESSRLFLLACRATFEWYNVHAVSLLCLSTRLGVLAHLPGTIICSKYSINPDVKQVYGHSYAQMSWQRRLASINAA